jgi:hypothetical protein
LDLTREERKEGNVGVGGRQASYKQRGMGQTCFPPSRQVGTREVQVHRPRKGGRAGYVGAGALGAGRWALLPLQYLRYPPTPFGVFLGLAAVAQPLPREATAGGAKTHTHQGALTCRQQWPPMPAQSPGCARAGGTSSTALGGGAGAWGLGLGAGPFLLGLVLAQTPRCPVGDWECDGYSIVHAVPPRGAPQAKTCTARSYLTTSPPWADGMGHRAALVCHHYSPTRNTNTPL